MPQWQPEPAGRPEPQAAGLTRTAIEIDGRRVLLGLPASLLAGMAVQPGDAAPAATAPPPADESAVTAPAAGTLVAWKVSEGAPVQAGELIAVMEAMKMEMQLHAHRAGSIQALAAAGGFHAAGAVLARIDGRTMPA